MSLRLHTRKAGLHTICAYVAADGLGWLLGRGVSRRTDMVVVVVVVRQLRMIRCSRRKSAVETELSDRALVSPLCRAVYPKELATEGRMEPYIYIYR
jgi:hypothetical protein